MTNTKYTIDCTGDVVTGDEIQFTEAVFGGSYRKPRFLGERTISTRVIKDSYGQDKQQHTFTIEIIHSEGECPLEPGTKTRRKGRNIYRHGTRRAAWTNETARHGAQKEKHLRGDAARDEPRGPVALMNGDSKHD